MKSTASKREEHLKITNVGITSNTITTSDMNNLVPKSKTYSDIIKGKMISKEEYYTEITNCEICASGSTSQISNPQLITSDTASYELTRKRQRQKAKHKKSNLFEKLTIGSMEILIDYSYNNGVQIMRTHVARSRKKLLILDVNGLLADIIWPPPKDCKSDKIILRRAIFKRPFLDDFLRFCFERFDVGIWSSRTRKVLSPVVDYLLGDLKKKLLFIWDSSHCTNSSARSLENWHKLIVFKDVKIFWGKIEFYDESNTLLLDDSPYKALLNPKYTGVFPLSYNYYDTNDNSLGPDGDLRVYLEGVGTTENVQMYVRQHPFGQSAIDEKSPQWVFYSKVLKDLSNKNI